MKGLVSSKVIVASDIGYEDEGEADMTVDVPTPEPKF